MTFKSAHKEYVEKIKEYDTGEEEMEIIIGKCSTYLREIEDEVYNVLAWNDNFRFKPKVPELKNKLSKKLKAHNKEKSKVIY